MRGKADAPRTITEYIAQYPPALQERLETIRRTIQAAAPEAVEVISYRMPAFRLNGILVYFAVFKNHIGFFPTASGVAAFREELSAFATSKGTIRFPHDQPIPYDLIRRIVEFRVREVLKK
ncbi:MAG TPA: DUF1801 domain-containing protein [bacterium]|nr:DUF1801 domain-containing protein [bacterium]HPR89414.1 DUF1801 domain-containing protein [bacterium]